MISLWVLADRISSHDKGKSSKWRRRTVTMAPQMRKVTVFEGLWKDDEHRISDSSKHLPKP